MPNWCSNQLVITGASDKIAEFATTIKDGNFLLSQTYPMPRELSGICSGYATIDGKECRNWREIDGKSVAVTEEELNDLSRKFGSTNWYNWNIENWGTKWDLNDGVTCEIDSERIACNFDTAWSPPVEWAINVSKKFPELTFELFYSEGGSGFYGSKTIENGEVTETYIGGSFWKDDIDEEAEDWNDNLTDQCREFMEDHGLHTGG